MPRMRAAASVLFRNRFAVRSLRVVPRSMSPLIMFPSRASISMNVRGLFLTTFKMSACHTGRNRRFSRGSDCIPAEICASRACMDRPMSRRTVDRDQLADIVGELHRPLPIARLAARVNDHCESAVQIGRGARFLGEEILRSKRPDLALHPDGNPLPGLKMPRISFRRSAGGEIEKSL